MGGVGWEWAEVGVCWVGGGWKAGDIFNCSMRQGLPHAVFKISRITAGVCWVVFDGK